MAGLDQIGHDLMQPEADIGRLGQVHAVDHAGLQRIIGLGDRDRRRMRAEAGPELGMQRALDHADALALDAGRRRERLLGEQMTGAVIDEAEHDETLRLVFALEFLAERPGQDTPQVLAVAEQERQIQELAVRHPGRERRDREQRGLDRAEAQTFGDLLLAAQRGIGHDAQVEAAGRTLRQCLGDTAPDLRFRLVLAEQRGDRDRPAGSEGPAGRMAGAASVAAAKARRVSIIGTAP